MLVFSISPTGPLWLLAGCQTSLQVCSQLVQWVGLQADYSQLILCGGLPAPIVWMAESL